MITTSKDVFHVTENLRLASALTAAGFALRHCNEVDNRLKRWKSVVCELDAEHHGVSAEQLREWFENVGLAHPEVGTITERVDNIVKERGITPEEYVILAFDAASAALQNRATILSCVKKKKPLIAKDIGNGRSIIYRDGTPPEELAAILTEANR